MNWLLFFAVAACFVATLLVLDNWEHLRTRFSRASGIGRKAPDVTRIATAASEIGRKVANASGSALSFLWRWKLPLLALTAFVVIAVTISGCVPDWGKSKDTLRAERDAALTDKTVAEHEADMGRTAVELAEETHADTARVRAVVARAEEELADAVELADFDALWSAYDRAYRGVWALGPGEDFPDPPPGRPDSLRGAGADLA